MHHAIAVIPTRLKQTVFGLPSLVAQPLAGATVLEHTVARVARVKQVRKVVLLHGPGEDPMALLGTRRFGKPVCGYEASGELSDVYQRMRAAARKWSLTAWRGGLGGATCYDELLPAGPLLEAVEHHKADSALLVGADWPLVDPDICDAVLDKHLQHSDKMQMTFSQAPPGLGGLAMARSLMSQIALQPHTTIGHMLAYNPTKPQADPIGLDVCIQIPATVRSCANRFVYDTPASAAMISAVGNHLGDRVTEATATEVVDAVADPGGGAAGRMASLPQMISLELTPRRLVSGPVTTQCHVALDRPDMPLDMARQIVSQMGTDRDTVLTLGGLGDALLHEHWDEVVAAAHDAGVLGIAVETDLQIDTAVLERLMELPIDVLSVRINADTTATYKKTMDPDDRLDDGFAKVIKNLQWLFNTRNAQTRRLLESPDGDSPTTAAGLPWVVLRMVKTSDTLAELEPFFDRWMYYTGHAVIESPSTGCGLAPDLSLVQMSPPGRFGCRQITRRMTVHSDGRVALCDQDWLARASVGDAAETPLTEIWQSMRTVREAHEAGQWDTLKICGACHEWHRP